MSTSRRWISSKSPTGLEQLAGRPRAADAASTFVEKAQLAPGCVFVVGVDTLQRIADPRYYDDDADRATPRSPSIAEQGCRFLVFGRHWKADSVIASDVEHTGRTLRNCVTKCPNPSFAPTFFHRVAWRSRLAIERRLLVTPT